MVLVSHENTPRCDLATWPHSVVGGHQAFSSDFGMTILPCSFKTTVTLFCKKQM